MVSLLWLLGAASATDLAFQLETGEGIQERWTKDHTGSWTAQFGPVVGRGKRSVRYDVTVPASVFDPLKNGFETRISVCRYWYKGSKRDRDCVEDLMVIPSREDGPLWVGGKIKGTDKFELRLGAYYEGPPPTAVGFPGAEPEPEPEPEPEVVEEVPEEELEPAKDEMTSTLESIASQVVDSLDEEEEAEEAATEEAADGTAEPDEASADEEAEGDKPKKKRKKKQD